VKRGWRLRCLLSSCKRQQVKVVSCSCCCGLWIMHVHWLQDTQACCTTPVNAHALYLAPPSLRGLVWQCLTQQFALVIAARACLAVWPHLTRNITPSHTHHDECTHHHQLTEHALHQLSHAPSQCTSAHHHPLTSCKPISCVHSLMNIAHLMSTPVLKFEFTD
jgi:hypothetical protein